MLVFNIIYKRKAHFPEGKTEVQRGVETCLASHRKLGVSLGPRFNTGRAQGLGSTVVGQVSSV